MKLCRRNSATHLEVNLERATHERASNVDSPYQELIINSIFHGGGSVPKTVGSAVTQSGIRIASM